MTVNQCQYLQTCRQWNCVWERTTICPLYMRIEDKQIDLAVQYYTDNKLTSEDWKWLAEHFSVPLGRLEIKLSKIER